MLRLRHIIACFALLIAIVGGSLAKSQQPPPGSGEIRQPEQTQTASPQQPPATDQRGTESAPFIVKVHPTPKTQAQTDQDANDRLDKAAYDNKTLIVSFLLVIVAFLQFIAICVQAIFLWCGFKEAKNASEISGVAAAAAKLSAEAAIGVELPRLFIGDLMFNESPGATIKENLKFPNVTIVIKNYGRTPAFLERRAVEMRIAPTLPEIPEYPKADYLDPGTVIEGGKPYDGLPTARIVEMASEETIDAMIKGEMRIWIYGFVAYHDFLNRPHRFAFGAHYRMPSDEPHRPPRFIFDAPPKYSESY